MRDGDAISAVARPSSSLSGSGAAVCVLVFCVIAQFRLMCSNREQLVACLHAEPRIHCGMSSYNSDPGGKVCPEPHPPGRRLTSTPRSPTTSPVSRGGPAPRGACPRLAESLIPEPLRRLLAPLHTGPALFKTLGAAFPSKCCCPSSANVDNLDSLLI